MLVAAAPALTACGADGFKPLYGATASGIGVEQRLAKVDFSPIPGRVGQRVRNELVFQTAGGGHPDTPSLRLEVVIKETLTSTLVRIDGESLSQVYAIEATFRLVNISDNGPGIAPNDQAVIFEKFHRVSDGESGNPMGSGLGLAISRKITEHFGGRIWVVSGRREGTCFSFTLPIEAA